MSPAGPDVRVSRSPTCARSPGARKAGAVTVSTTGSRTRTEVSDCPTALPDQTTAMTHFAVEVADRDFQPGGAIRAQRHRPREPAHQLFGGRRRLGIGGKVGVAPSRRTPWARRWTGSAARKDRAADAQPALAK